MYSFRTHVIICVSLFGAMIGLAILGNVLEKLGVPPPTGAARYIVMALFFGLFIAAGLSAIPVIVKLVLGTQVAIGNASVPAVAAALRREKTIIWTLWGLIIAGRNLGVLAARPDMTVDEMVRQSTMKIDVRYARSAIAGGGSFEFVIPGTAIRFADARYYYINTYSDDATHIQSLSVGTSPEKASVAAIDSADAELRARLTSDGWLAGHEEFRTALGHVFQRAP